MMGAPHVYSGIKALLRVGLRLRASLRSSGLPKLWKSSSACDAVL
jgi:hypothetical protein